MEHEENHVPLVIINMGKTENLVEHNVLIKIWKYGHCEVCKFCIYLQPILMLEANRILGFKRLTVPINFWNYYFALKNDPNPKPLPNLTD